MVDDELDITVALKMALEESGFFQVEAFYESVLALSRFKAYDLALLDIHAENIVHCINPEGYQKCMVGMKRNLIQTLEIAETVSDPKTKLQARTIANDCYRYIMDLCNNDGIVSNALKFVDRKTEP